MKIVNIDAEHLHIYWTTGGTSTRLIWKYVIYDNIKSQKTLRDSFTLLLEVHSWKNCSSDSCSSIGKVRVTSSNLRVTSSNPRATSSNSWVTSSSSRVTNFHSWVRTLKARVARLKARVEFNPQTKILKNLFHNMALKSLSMTTILPTYFSIGRKICT